MREPQQTVKIPATALSTMGRPPDASAERRFLAAVLRSALGAMKDGSDHVRQEAVAFCTDPDNAILRVCCQGLGLDPVLFTAKCRAISRNSVSFKELASLSLAEDCERLRGRNPRLSISALARLTGHSRHAVREALGREGGES